MGKKSTLSAEQRVQAVLRLLSKEETAVRIARRAGVSEQTLYRWRDEFLSGGKHALNGRRGESSETKTIERLKAELAERDQVIGEITVANRILKKTLGRPELTEAVRSMIEKARETAQPPLRLTHLLHWLGITRSVWYARKETEPKKPGRKPRPVPEELAAPIRKLAVKYPWWGYKRIAVIARRSGLGVTNRLVYRMMKAAGLLQKRRVREAQLYQTARLFELLPQKPNELWQADVTHIHIPGRGWWYAVTVIDYYSRYLLACHFTPSYCAADVAAARDVARAEAERFHGPLEKMPFLVTDNGPSFVARAFRKHIDGDYAHVRSQYRTPTQLGLLERFHQTLKTEEVYWNLYYSPGEARESLEAFRRRYNEAYCRCHPPRAVRCHCSSGPAGARDACAPRRRNTCAAAQAPR